MDHQRGFTLVEMLVSLALFATLSAVGVGLLRGSVMGQQVMQERLAASSAITRLHAILVQDLAQAVVRPTRGAVGDVRTAFAGDSSGFTLVRGGVGGADGSAPGVQRISYRLVDGGWHRQVDAVLDGGPDAAAVTPDLDAALLRGLDRAMVRYRGADGRWQEAWRTVRDTPASPPLPLVVEITLSGRDAPPLTMAFLLPTTRPPAGAAGDAR